MINVTDKLQYFKPVNHSAAREAIERVIKETEVWTNSVGKRSRVHAKAFSSCFSLSRLRDGVELDSEFVNAVFDFAASDARHRGTRSAAVTFKKYFDTLLPPACAYSYFKRGCKVFLYDLWDKGFVGLPISFLFGSHFQFPNTTNELFQIILNCETGKSPRSGNPGATAIQIQNYMYRVILTSDWKTCSDFSLDEYAQLHRAVILAKKDGNLILSNSPFPWTAFLEYILQTGSAATFDAHDLNAYRVWTLGRIAAECEFAEFRVTARRQLSTGNLVALNMTGDVPFKRKPTSGYIKFGAVVGDGNILHEALLSEVIKTRGARSKNTQYDWRKQTPLYPGREHASIEEAGAAWIPLMKDFLAFKQIRNKSKTDKEMLYTLNSLVDYVFLYLPWFIELFPETIVAAPQNPSQFTRFPFVDWNFPSKAGDCPIGIIEFIELFRPNDDSRKRAINNLREFFNHLATRCRGNPAVGANFTNPINRLDGPESKKGKKTNKIPFPRKIYPLVVGYAYSIEAFGAFLQEAFRDGRLTADRFRCLKEMEEIDCTSAGYVPIYFLKNRFYAINFIPDIYNYSATEFKIQSNESEDFEIETQINVHVTIPRMFTCAMENGLRLQSIQWLDILSWDSLNKLYGKNSEFSYTWKESQIYELFVNTDKIKTSPWSPPISYNIRAMLLREEAFQYSLHPTAESVPYENEPNSKWGKIHPLMRSSVGPAPFSDTHYHRKWLQSQMSLQRYLQTKFPELRHIRLVAIRPYEEGESAAVVTVCDPDFGTLTACEVHYRAIVTPHGCRATFATNRSKFLGFDDTGLFLGHEGASQTRHYYNPSIEQIKERFLEGFRGELGDMFLLKVDEVTRVVSADIGAAIRADAEDSALRRAYKRDRDATIASFGFMPPLILWSVEDNASAPPDGMALLRNAPTDNIHFLTTHICPVGQECPAEVLEMIGAPRRCGLCPIAMKCVDHLPAIGAKIRFLLRRVMFAHSRRRQLEQAGQPEEMRATVDQEAKLDMDEYAGWRKCERVLEDIRSNMERSESNMQQFVAERPEIIQRHLKVVLQRNGESELAIQRLFDVAAYPSLADQEVELQASILKRKILSASSLEELGFSEATPDVIIAARALCVQLSLQPVHRDEVRKLLEPALEGSVS